MPRGGRLIVVSGPSGVGKSTVVQRLLERCPLPLVLSVSATTRPPRPGEVDGRDYHFLTHAEFARRRAAGEFLESAEVFGSGHWYGTLRDAVATGLRGGKWVILEIDVQGARQVRQAAPDAITVFVHPGDVGELERRLRGRGTETPAELQRRLDVAAAELQQAAVYHHIVVNRDIDQTAQAICQLLRARESNDV